MTDIFGNNIHLNKPVFEAVQKATRNDSKIDKTEWAAIQKAMAQDEQIDTNELAFMDALKNGVSFTVEAPNGKTAGVESISSDILFPEVSQGAAAMVKGHLQNVQPLEHANERLQAWSGRFKTELVLKAAQGNRVAQEDLEKNKKMLLTRIEITLKSFPDESGKQLNNLPGIILREIEQALKDLNFKSGNVEAQLQILQAKLIGLQTKVIHKNENTLEKQELLNVIKTLQKTFDINFDSLKSADTLFMRDVGLTAEKMLDAKATQKVLNQFATHPNDLTPINNLQIRVAQVAAHLEQSATQLDLQQGVAEAAMLKQALAETADALNAFAKADLSDPSKLLEAQHALQTALDNALGFAFDSKTQASPSFRYLKDLHAQLSAVTSTEDIEQRQGDLEQAQLRLHVELDRDLAKYDSQAAPEERLQRGEFILELIKFDLKQFYQHGGQEIEQQPALQVIDILSEEDDLISAGKWDELATADQELERLLSQIDDPKVKETLSYMRNLHREDALLTKGVALFRESLRYRWQAGGVTGPQEKKNDAPAWVVGVVDLVAKTEDPADTKRRESAEKAAQNADKAQAQYEVLKAHITDPATLKKLDTLAGQAATDITQTQIADLMEKCNKLSAVDLAKTVFNESVTVLGQKVELRGIATEDSKVTLLRLSGMEEEQIQKLIKADQEILSILDPMSKQIKDNMSAKFKAAKVALTELKAKGKLNPTDFYRHIQMQAEAAMLQHAPELAGNDPLHAPAKAVFIKNFIQQKLSLSEKDYKQLTNLVTGKAFDYYVGDMQILKGEPASEEAIGKFLLDKLDDLIENIDDEIEYLGKSKDSYTSTFKLMKKYPKAREEVYKSNKFYFCLQHNDKFPPLQGGKDVAKGIMTTKLVDGRIDSQREAVFMAVAEDWDDDVALKDGLIDAAVWIASTAIACIPGGGAALVAVKTIAQVGLATAKITTGVINADNAEDEAKAGFQVGEVTMADLNRAAENNAIDKIVRDAIVDMVANYVGGGVSNALSKHIATKFLASNPDVCAKLYTQVLNQAKALGNYVGGVTEEGLGALAKGQSFSPVSALINVGSNQLSTKLEDMISSKKFDKAILDAMGPQSKWEKVDVELPPDMIAVRPQNAPDKILVYQSVGKDFVEVPPIDDKILKDVMGPQSTWVKVDAGLPPDMIAIRPKNAPDEIHVFKKVGTTFVKVPTPEFPPRKPDAVEIKSDPPSSKSETPLRDEPSVAPKEKPDVPVEKTDINPKAGVEVAPTTHAEHLSGPVPLTPGQKLFDGDQRMPGTETKDHKLVLRGVRGQTLKLLERVKKDFQHVVRMIHKGGDPAKAQRMLEALEARYGKQGLADLYVNSAGDPSKLKFEFEGQTYNLREDGGVVMSTTDVPSTAKSYGNCVFVYNVPKEKMFRNSTVEEVFMGTSLDPYVVGTLGKNGEYLPLVDGKPDPRTDFKTPLSAK